MVGGKQLTFRRYPGVTGKICGKYFNREITQRAQMGGNPGMFLVAASQKTAVKRL
jgi:hypothetical protein